MFQKNFDAEDYLLGSLSSNMVRPTRSLDDGVAGVKFVGMGGGESVVLVLTAEILRFAQDDSACVGRRRQFRVRVRAAAPEDRIVNLDFEDDGED
jgi:hypothetical protein